jgi:hypothetical protein
MSGPLESLFSSIAGGGSGRRDDANTTLDLDQILAALTDKAGRMSKPCPFSVGQFVTPRLDADVKGGGHPHIVVDVFAEAVTDPSAEAGSNQFMRKFDMSVAHYHGNDMTVHAVDGSCFEPWTDAHAITWRAKQNSHATSGGATRPVTSDTPFNDIVRMLRGEGRKLMEAKITWKKGDLIEILGYQASNAAKPMLFEGKALGAVEVVDKSDDTTKVTYFDEDGDRRSQWFKPIDLKPFTAVEPVES